METKFSKKVIKLQKEFKKLTPKENDEIYDYYNERVKYFNEMFQNQLHPEGADTVSKGSEHHDEYLNEQFIKIEDEIYQKYGVTYK